MAQQLESPRRAVPASGAIVLGLGGMLGAGLFVGLAPAAAAGGVWLLLGVPIAAVAAGCSALSAVEQSAAYRGAGSVYACVRDKLGTVPGRIAVSAFTAGHVAAMAAVADSLGNYLPAPEPATAVVAVLLVALASTAGLRVRGAAAWLWLALTLGVLAVVVAACLAIAPVPSAAEENGAPVGSLAAAATMFFGFLGFERLAAPAHERDRYDRRATRRGLVISVVGAAVTYLLVGSAVLYQLGAVRLALSPTPLTGALRAADAVGLTTLVQVGAVLAMLPVLLGVLESARSTGIAAVGAGDLPAGARRAGGRMGSPVRGEGSSYALDLTIALAAGLLSVLVEPRQALTVAACCLLVHYALANASARVLLAGRGKRAPWAPCLGMVLCVVLTMSMPVPAMLATLVVVVVGPALSGLLCRARQRKTVRPGAVDDR